MAVSATRTNDVSVPWRPRLGARRPRSSSQ